MRALIIERDFLRRSVNVEIVKYFKLFKHVYFGETLSGSHYMLNQIDVLFISVENDQHFQQILEELKEQTHIKVIPLVEKTEAYIVKDTEAYIEKPMTLSKVERALRKILSESEQTEQLKVHAELRIKMFSDIMIDTMEPVDVKWRTRKVKELFAYLIHFKDTKYLETSYILEALWPGLPEKNAKNLLHTSIYHLRKLLKLFNYNYSIRYKHGKYELRIPFKTDVDIVQQSFKEQPSPQNIKQVMNYYKGRYLEREDYTWAEEFRQNIHEQVIQYIQLGLKNEKVFRDEIVSTEAKHFIEKYMNNNEKH